MVQIIMASQLFRGAAVATMDHSTTWVTTATGGVLQNTSTIRITLGPGACPTIAGSSTGATAARLLVFLSVASRISNFIRKPKILRVVTVFASSKLKVVSAAISPISTTS